MDLQLYVLKRDRKVVWNVYENLTEIEDRVEHRVKNLNLFVKRLAFSQNLNAKINFNSFRFKEIHFNIK